MADLARGVIEPPVHSPLMTIPVLTPEPMRIPKNNPSPDPLQRASHEDVKVARVITKQGSLYLCSMIFLMDRPFSI
jgi:hypothetical protein